MEYTIKELLRAMGMKIVDEKKADEYSTYNECYFVVETPEGTFFKVSYYANSYGDDITGLTYKSVKPRPVEKVEYI